MARVTIEDCLQNIGNRFELVLVAAKRAKQLEQAATPLVATDGDKVTVIALREVAAGLVGRDQTANDYTTMSPLALTPSQSTMALSEEKSIDLQETELEGSEDGESGKDGGEQLAEEQWDDG